MKPFRWIALGWSLPLLALAADLPPDAIVLRVLQQAPQVRAAGSQLQAEQANRQRLEAGTQEWTARLSGQQRRATELSGDNRYREWQVGVERPIRLPGKAAADAEIGARGVAAAELGVGDARHETARLLLKSWFTWLREGETAKQWQQQQALLAEQAQAVGRRQQLGDAAKVEAMLAEAATAQARAQLTQAEAKRRVAEEDLRRRFPALALPVEVQPGAPQALEGDAEFWMNAILSEHHELGMAREESRLQQAIAQRADRDRVPDPTIGMHVGRERSGEERILGVTLSIPFPGEARRASAAVASAHAQAAAAREAGTRQRIEAEAAAAYQSALAGFTSWQQSRDAADRLTRVAELVTRGYRLGEGSLNDVLTARRLAHEAQLAERLARLEALESRYRLLLDAHKLWDFDE